MSKGTALPIDETTTLQLNSNTIAAGLDAIGRDIPSTTNPDKAIREKEEEITLIRNYIIGAGILLIASFIVFYFAIRKK